MYEISSICGLTNREEISDMLKNRNINTIISIASVLIMIVWGTLAGTYKHAWLAVFAGGALIAILGAYNKGKPGAAGDKEKDGDTVDVTVDPVVEPVVTDESAED